VVEKLYWTESGNHRCYKTSSSHLLKGAKTSPDMRIEHN
jgi:hypothetical protein